LRRGPRGRTTPRPGRGMRLRRTRAPGRPRHEPRGSPRPRSRRRSGTAARGRGSPEARGRHAPGSNSGRSTCCGKRAGRGSGGRRDGRPPRRRVASVRYSVAVDVGVAPIRKTVAVHVPVAGVRHAVAVDVAVAGIGGAVTVDVAIAPVGRPIAVHVGITAVRGPIAVDVPVAPVAPVVAVQVAIAAVRGPVSVRVDSARRAEACPSITASGGGLRAHPADSSAPDEILEGDQSLEVTDERTLAPSRAPAGERGDRDEAHQKEKDAERDGRDTAAPAAAVLLVSSKETPHPRAVFGGRASTFPSASDSITRSDGTRRGRVRTPVRAHARPNPSRRFGTATFPSRPRRPALSGAPCDPPRIMTSPPLHTPPAPDARGTAGPTR